VFNRIRRAISLASRRHRPRGRHRRSLTPAGPTVIAPAQTGGPTLVMRQHRGRADVIVGEETALVRPYVMTSEERARHRTTAAPHRLPFDSWSTPTGAH
jgi:hypothetical protein